MGSNENHRCFLCDQNKVGRPRELEESNSETSKSVCSKCLQKYDRGISHPCLQSTKTSVENITSTLLQMEPEIHNQVVYNILKSKQDITTPSTSQKVISLQTAGTSATVLLNPSIDTHQSNIPTNILDQIRSQAGLTQNQTKIVTGGLRASLGRTSIPPYYNKHTSEQSKVLDHFYIHETHSFITATESGKPVKYDNIWAVYAPIVPLVEYINAQRENSDLSNFMIKIMCDSGQGKTKVCLCIIPITDSNVTKKARSGYAEGGILAKGGQYSGINKCILCFCAPEIKEHHWNLSNIFDLIKIYDVFTYFENVIVTGDLKLLNEIYGLMEGSAKHPCLYCTVEQQQLAGGQPRTLDSLMYDHESWKSNSGDDKTRKYYNNVKNPPLLHKLSEKIPILKITPPPILHIMLGVFNHIWQNMEKISNDHENPLQNFALKHNCVREAYHGKTFEGNECAKLMNKITADDDLLSNLKGIERHIKALQILNNLRKQMFGTTLIQGWKTSLIEFNKVYQNIPNITKPVKLHILLSHCDEFLNLYGLGKGLGFFSEQTGEAVHYKFETIFRKYKIKNIHSETYGQRLRKAVVEFSSTHI